MTLQLPRSIATFFGVSNGTDPALPESCLTDTAWVHDEGETHRGQDAICAWMTATKAKYHYSVEPVSATVDDDAITVVAHVTGNFPGNSVTLQYRFALLDERIASLEIFV